ncbi:hypothetical protein BDW59DRAFT_162989 [Aspergillus cavernicola]|uniref:STI1 domain-containing protein n=1 Tax=Aspergillus cavernicola TaxID=176166 RepID=A0ABR4IA47_9EURO
MASADELRSPDNRAFMANQFDEAIYFCDKFTKAIAIQSSNHILYSNRPAAYASKKAWDSALQDAEKTIQLMPGWAKGYIRKGPALRGKGDLMGALNAYEDGLKHEATPQLETERTSVWKAIEQEDPVFSRLDPTSSPDWLFNSPAKPTPTLTNREPEAEAEEVNKEALENKKLKEEADKEKTLGMENYKKRDFDKAIVNYSKAWETFKDITYLINLGAAYGEKGDYDTYIKACIQAIGEGRESRMYYKLIASIIALTGTVYEKRGELALAIEYFQKSLTEHRTPEVQNKLHAAEQAKKEAEDNAYTDLAKAEEACHGGLLPITGSLEQAREADIGYANTSKIEAMHMKVMMSIHMTYYFTEEQFMERLRNDPEVMEIMQDPVMQQILQQAQSDPGGLQDHMKNPSVRLKIQKLAAAGVMRIG